jgi:uncharacterized protein with HEPN domain
MSDSSETALPSVTERFAHIASMIHEIEQALLGISRKTARFGANAEIISVASDYIPINLKAAEGDVDWQAIAAIGERLENTRHRIEADVLWTISRDKLAPLKVCAERHLRRQFDAQASSS